MNIPLRHGALFCVLAFIFASTAFAQTVRSVPGTYPTIQSAVDSSAAGDTVAVASGTFTEQLLVTKNLILSGSGATSIIKAPPVLADNGFGKNIVEIKNGASVEIFGFTVSGPGPSGCGSITAGIFVGGGASATIRDNTITHVRDEPISGCQNGAGIFVGRAFFGTTGTATITNNVINDYQKGGIVVDNVGSSAVITGNTVTGAGPVNFIAQNGIQISRGATATLTGNTVSGNAYTPSSDIAAGILLFKAGDATVVGLNTVSGNEVGVWTSVQATIGNIDLSGFTSNGRNGVADYDGGFPGDLLNEYLAWTSPPATFADDNFATGTIDGDGGDIVNISGASLHVLGWDAFAVIQTAVDSASSGSTVSVAAGMYTEQLNISKDITLRGVGTGLTTVVSPSTLSTSFGSKKIVVYVRNTDNVVIEKLTVDGAGLGNANNQFVGIGFRNAGGTVDSVEVKRMRETPLNGVQHGVGIYALNDSGATRNVTVTNSSIFDYQKGGIVLNGAMTSATVTNNTVTGIGNTTAIAQNGVQLGFGASGVVNSNSVSGNVWTGIYSYAINNNPLTDPDADGSAGILLYMPGANVEIMNNTLTANQFGIWTVAAPDVNIHDNSIVGLTHTGNAYPTGIAIWSADQWTAGSGGSETATADTIQRNAISNHDYGLVVYNFTAGEPAPHATVRRNAISGSNLFGAWGNVAVDAIQNWWGSATGPTHASNTGGSGDAVNDSVSFNPWYVDSARTTLVASQEVVLTQDTTTVGTAGVMLTLNITSVPDSANFLVAYQAGSPTDSPITGETYPENVSQRAAIIWGIVKTGNVTANLVFDYSGVPGISNPSTLRLIKRAAPDSPWVDITAQFTNDVINRRFTANGVSSFSEFTIGSSSDNPLPVQMTTFTATTNGLNTVIRWTTATEVNSHSFEIQRRRARTNDDLSWTTVGTLSGAGTSSSPNHYEFIDEVPAAGWYAYQIKQIDRNGLSSYTEMLEVEIGLAPRAFMLGQNYPNPFNPATVITFTLPEDGFVKLKVFNLVGQEVALLVNGMLKSGIQHRVNFDASSLPSGVYFARIEFGGQSLIQKMVLFK